jgi:hypothetical protein
MLPNDCITGSQIKDAGSEIKLLKIGRRGFQTGSAEKVKSVHRKLIRNFKRGDSPLFYFQ